LQSVVSALSGCRNGRAIGRHDLRLERKDLARASIHPHLEAAHVVVAGYLGAGLEDGSLTTGDPQSDAEIKETLEK